MIGCLLEKQVTTPEQYPLSLNALINACNQKSNRDPVTNLDEATVQRALEDLTRRHLIVEKSGFGSRVPKYQHRFCNTEHGSLDLSVQELAILCELLLRGPQTPGELRAHAARMADFADLAVVEATLRQLALREDGPFVTRLPREPGRRDSRYNHLFGEQPATAGGGEDPEPLPEAVRPFSPHEDRLARIEEELRELRGALEALKRRLGDGLSSS
ncbi:MAG: hypothetical protein HONDAALG_00323 [Gammaproteobacteria bacterium]|nr:hypothetical protein [Gammaproteobacteria bacterium]